ncbi:MAG: hypothetical protein H6867_07495 [Rhodospirillales bacterium]|nr:hypothetical protein [Rhodospirillales bacterium]MCB9995396.1 hypothetical protein [Rhodospirillales bacterium]
MNRNAFIIMLFFVFGFGLSGLVHAQESSAVFSGGSVKIGYDGRTCDGSLEGSIRYNSSGPAMECCDGASWASCGGGSTCGIYAISFTDQVDVAKSTVISSDIIQVNTDSCTADVAVSGDGSPQYRICSNSSCSVVDQTWGNTAGTVAGGKYVQMRLTSSASGNTTLTARLTLGSATITDWDVTTVPDGRQVFITSASWAGDLKGITGATYKCQDAADTAGLTGIFRPWLTAYSTSLEPQDIFTQSSIPYLLVTGTKIADNWTDLVDGSIDAIIDRDENGTQQTGREVWSNTTTSGARKNSGGNNHCFEWTSGNGGHGGEKGDNTYADSRWTDNGTASACSGLKRLYCFEQAPDPVGAHKKIFITSSTWNGNLGGLSGANNKCQTAADNASLGGTYKAWITDTNSSNSPSNTFTQASIPYRRIDGYRIADNWSDLTDGLLDNGIIIDETGAVRLDQEVWTNTTTSGTRTAGGGNDTCFDWASGSSGNSGQSGNNQFMDSKWTNETASACNGAKRLICVEQ